MSQDRREVELAAVGWLARLNDPDFEDWDAWEAWLVASPAHADVYWRLAEADADAIEALTAAPAPAVQAPAVPSDLSTTSRIVGGARRRSTAPVGRPQTRRWFAYAAAAAAATVVFGGLWWNARPQTWSVETAPGEQRTVALADGSALYLDGATRVTLDRRQPRHASLEQGRFLVEVVHDEQDPFTVLVGDAVLTDLGTAFDVTRLDDGLRIAVSEGVVRVDVEQQAVTLRAGEALQATDGRLVRQTVPAEDIGTWRGGRLVYQQERLSIVAGDLSRALGIDVTTAPEIADRLFTGSLAASGPPEALRPRLELVLGVRIIETGSGWRLEPRPGA